MTDHRDAQLRELRDLATRSDGWEEALELALTLAGERHGDWIVFNELWSAEAAWGPQVAAFVAASRTDRLGEGTWPILATLLSAPTHDPGVLINTTSAAQVAPRTKLGRAVLAAHLPSFVERCNQGNRETRSAGRDLLARLANLGDLTKVISKAWLEKYVTEEEPDLSGQECEALRNLNAQQWRPEISEQISLPESLTTRVRGHSTWFDAARESISFLSREVWALPAFAELTQASARQQGTLQELRLTGESTEGGRIRAHTFESVLKGWQRLYSALYAKVESTQRTPELFVLAPATGSFVIRLLVDPAAGSVGTATAAFEKSVAIMQGRDGADSASEGELTGFVSSIHKALREEKLSLAVQTATNGSRASRLELSPRRLEAVSRRVPVALEFSSDRVSGYLEAANRSNGRVVVRIADSQQTVTGEVARESRDILINKVIGHQYVFEGEQQSRADSTDNEKFVIIRISPVTDSDDTTAADAPSPASGYDLTTVPTTYIPQQDTFERIEQIVELMSRGKAPSPATMGMPHGTRKQLDSSKRHIDYARQAARILGLIGAGSLREEGFRLVRLSPERRRQLLAILFQTSYVGAAWLDWAGKSDVKELDPSTAEAFLRERGRRKGKLLSESMIERRGRTLKKWAEVFVRISDNGS